MKQRLAALLPDPELAILDEPTNGWIRPGSARCGRCWAGSPTSAVTEMRCDAPGALLPWPSAGREDASSMTLVRFGSRQRRRWPVSSRVVVVLRALGFRYDEEREGYILRGVGERLGPVFRIKPRR